MQPADYLKVLQAQELIEKAFKKMQDAKEAKAKEKKKIGRAHV